MQKACSVSGCHGVGERLSSIGRLCSAHFSHLKKYADSELILRLRVEDEKINRTFETPDAVRFLEGTRMASCHPDRKHASRGMCQECDSRDRSYFEKVGITLKTYEARNAALDGKCEICTQEDGVGRRLAADHCHKTGKFRGLLCGSCNPMLGLGKDDPAILRKAALYLEGRHKDPLPGPVKHLFDSRPEPEDAHYW